MNAGYLPLWRKFFDHPFWVEKRAFSKSEAWIDILANTQYEKAPQQRLVRGRVVIQNYGEAILSTRYCGQRWGWHKTSVERFFKLLEKMEMCGQRCVHSVNVLIITNFATYDVRNSTDVDTDVDTSGPLAGHWCGQSKEGKEGKEGKEYIHCREGVPFEEIVAHLNQKTKSNFKPTSKETQKHIKARWNDGYRLEDFLRVIDNMCSKWLNDPKMMDFLRPYTLFGTKFESYLNAKNGRESDDDRLKSIRELFPGRNKEAGGGL